MTSHVSDLIDRIVGIRRLSDDIPATMAHGDGVIEVLKREVAETLLQPIDRIGGSNFFGIPVCVDYALPEGVVEIRTANGKVLRRIEGIK